MDAPAKLGSFEAKRAFQGTELRWRVGRCGGSPLGHPGNRGTGNSRFWAGQDRVDAVAGDRHAARQDKRVGVLIGIRDLGPKLVSVNRI